jgi:hypothetical protein
LLSFQDINLGFERFVLANQVQPAPNFICYYSTFPKLGRFLGIQVGFFNLFILDRRGRVG